MATITFNIPDEHLPRVRDGMLEVFPNTETIPDPDWVDPQDGSEAPQIAKYTDNQWLKEVIRRYIRNSTIRGETAIAKRNAATTITEADSIIT